MLVVRRRAFFVALLIVLGIAGSAAAAPESNRGVARTHATAAAPGRAIVRFRSTTDARARAAAATTAAERVQALAVRTGMHFNAVREVGPDMQLIALDGSAGAPPDDSQMAAMRADVDVEFAEPDYRRFRHAVPNDTLYNTTVNNIVGQWYLRTPPSPAVTPTGDPLADVALNSALDFERAWDTTTGSPSVVIAVLDTGVRYDHPDLTARLLPGFDFVSGESTTSFLRANDNDGWDSDASDPGDWIEVADLSHSVFADCTIDVSSWHGTRVTGLIGADTNNNAGVAGATWQAKILPVRVLGKCFGNDSDIINAMRWAAGLHVTGVPDNLNPARVINLSLGSASSCPSTYQTVITELTSHNVVVIASAGNDGTAVESPANCPGIVAVAGIRHAGTKVGYSNLGSQVAVSAPAGNCVNTGAGQPCLYSLITTTDVGQHSPVASGYMTQDDGNENIGTSFSSPLVSAIAALMISVHTNLTPPQVTARLKEGALPFPVSTDPTVPMCANPSTGGTQGFECSCTTALCGAGMANAYRSVNAALRPVASIAAVITPAAGETVSLDGSASAAANGRTITTYAWTAVTVGAAVPANPAVAQTSVVAPASGSVVTYRLTVTDSVGAQDQADVTFTVATPPPAAGGGGALDPLALLIVAAGLARRRRRA